MFAAATGSDATIDDMFTMAEVLPRKEKNAEMEKDKKVRKVMAVNKQKILEQKEPMDSLCGNELISLHK